jgi:hypothetical protein
MVIWKKVYSLIINNYQYFEKVIGKLYKTYFSINEKQRTEWSRFILMIICFEITYGRYLNDTAKMFREAEEKQEVALHLQLTPVHVIEIEDEKNET